MVLESLWSTLEAWPLAARIGESWWFPLLESLHVLTAALLVGSILLVDLRLLGLASWGQSVSRLTQETLLWTWAAFALALISGLGMFITRASYYVANTAFQAKAVLLLLAAINVLAFHFITARSMAQWDSAARLPAAARFAGGCSLALWVGVMLAGRWIGHLI